METEEVDLVVINTLVHEGNAAPVVRIRNIPQGKYNKAAFIKYAFGVTGRKNRLATWFLCATNKLMRSELLFEENGAPIRFKLGMTHLEDGAFLMDIARNVRSVYFEEAGLYHNRSHGESAMHSLDVQKLVWKMLDGYDVLIQSRILRENGILMQYARHAQQRAARYYTKQLVENGVPEGLDQLYARFSDDAELKSVLDEVRKCANEVTA